MSRIAVELARSVEEQRPGRSEKNRGNLGPGNELKVEKEGVDTTNSKRKREDTQQSGDSKLQEYLQVMQPPSKSKTWENQDAQHLNATRQPETVSELKFAAEGIDDEEYEHVPKKGKKSQEETRPSETLELPSPPITPAADKEFDIIGEQEPEQSESNEPAEPTDAPPASSDADWLRSRTSRLLGLVDDDDILESPAIQQEEEKSKGNNHRQPAKLAKEGDVGAEIHNNEEHSQAAPHDAVNIIEEEPAASTGRLFLRNLTYTITEEDLQNHFEGHGYGAIEEVSLVSHSVILLIIFRHKMNVQIGTAYAEHVMLPGRAILVDASYFLMTFAGHRMLLMRFTDVSADTLKIILPKDSRTGNNKGYAHIQFADCDAATRALEGLDQRPLQGRLLHVLPGNSKKQSGLDEFAISKLSLKKQQQIKKRAEAASNTFNWNSMYMNVSIPYSIAGRVNYADQPNNSPMLS